MTTVELKNQVIDKIAQLTDNNILMEVNKLIDDNIFDTETYLLSNDHKNAINLAINQIKDGDFLTNDQVNNDIDKWLKK